MKTSADLAAISHMATFGGRFAQALAKAALAADDENLSLIKCTWPAMWEKYAQWLKPTAARDGEDEK
jgi:hypothetical protein